MSKKSKKQLDLLTANLTKSENEKLFMSFKIAMKCTLNHNKRNMDKVLIRDGMIIATDGYRMFISDKVAFLIEDGLYEVNRHYNDITYKKVMELEISEKDNGMMNYAPYHVIDSTIDKLKYSLKLNTNEKSYYYTEIIRAVNNNMTFNLDFIIDIFNGTVKEYNRHTLTGMSSDHSLVKIQIEDDNKHKLGDYYIKAMRA